MVVLTVCRGSCWSRQTRRNCRPTAATASASQPLRIHTHAHQSLKSDSAPGSVLPFGESLSVHVVLCTWFISDIGFAISDCFFYSYGYTLRREAFWTVCRVLCDLKWELFSYWDNGTTTKAGPLMIFSNYKYQYSFPLKNFHYCF